MNEVTFPDDPDVPGQASDGDPEEADQQLEQDAEEEDQDAGPTTMAPPGEGVDAQGQVG